MATRPILFVWVLPTLGTDFGSSRAAQARAGFFRELEPPVDVVTAVLSCDSDGSDDPVRVRLPPRRRGHPRLVCSFSSVSAGLLPLASLIEQMVSVILAARLRQLSDTVHEREAEGGRSLSISDVACVSPKRRDRVVCFSAHARRRPDPFVQTPAWAVSSEGCTTAAGVREAYCLFLVQAPQGIFWSGSGGVSCQVG